MCCSDQHQLIRMVPAYGPPNNSEVDMNSKKAKALRRDARTYGASAPEIASVTLRNGQNINAPFSQRGLYRRLKQETKDLAPHGKDI